MCGLDFTASGTLKDAYLPSCERGAGSFSLMSRIVSAIHADVVVVAVVGIVPPLMVESLP